MSFFDTYTCSNFTTDEGTYTAVFEHFDTNKSGYLESGEFSDLLKDLVTLDREQFLADRDVLTILTTLDLDNDGRLSLNEFKSAWKFWLKQILNPVKALLVVDVQNDFISGSLALSNCPAGQDGAAVVPVINRLLEKSLFDFVVYTHDWHPENHISFVDNVHLRELHSTCKISKDKVNVYDTIIFEINGSAKEQIMWPRHCLQGTWGAQLHQDLKVAPNALHVNKGTKPDIDSYSAFWDNNRESQTELCSVLKERQVTDVYVCGLAYEFCVGMTCKDAVSHGFRTVFIEDAVRGVMLDGITQMKQHLSEHGVYFTDSDQVGYR